MGLQDAMRVADDNYSDLVARKEADQRVIAEITNLTEQVHAAARVFQGTLQQAALAAEPLLFPRAVTLAMKQFSSRSAQFWCPEATLLCHRTATGGSPASGRRRKPLSRQPGRGIAGSDVR